MATRVQPTTTRGGAKLSDEARAKLSAAGKAQWAALSPEEQAARLARIGRPRRADPPANGGPPNPLDDAPRARPGAGPALEGRSQHLGAPPRFVVPDLPPLELGADDEQPVAGDVEPAGFGFAVSEEDVADLVELPFDLLSLRRGDHWKLRPAESELLARRLARKINEHAVIARAVDAGGDWVALVGGLSYIVSVRIREDERRARAARDGSGASGGAPPAARRDRDDAVRRGAPAALGTLNGYAVSPGADDDAGAPAMGTEPAQRTLAQAL